MLALRENTDFSTNLDYPLNENSDLGLVDVSDCRGFGFDHDS